jgi:hypothetical protein
VSEINTSITRNAEDAGMPSTTEDTSPPPPPPPRPQQDLNDDVKDMIESEWSNEIKCALTANRHLGPIHVLALAHVLRRPIIVYGERSVAAGMSSGRCLCAQLCPNYCICFSI